MAAESNAFPAGAPAALLARPLRANPAFDLVLVDRLEPAERRWLDGAERDPDHYGVLRPAAGSGLGHKLVDRETALLFFTLAAQPGPLPAYARQRLGDAGAAEALARLVADGVLEIAAEEGGAGGVGAACELGAVGESGGRESGAVGGGARFVSGAAALPLLAAAGAPGAPGAAGDSRLAALSLAALRYGEELARADPAADALALSLALYGFHRRPLTPGWRRRLPDAAAVRRLAGLDPGGAGRARLDALWREEPAPASPAPTWLRFSPRIPAPGAARGAAVFKLYISPAPEALAGAAGDILAALAAAGAPPFKLAASAAGVLRPDKLVAYFARLDDLAAAASVVAARLAGVAAQGVPFTAAVTADGLLSWGVDPPARSGGSLPWEGGSWRLWLTHQLARALRQALAAPAAPADCAAAGAGGPARLAAAAGFIAAAGLASATPVSAGFTAAAGPAAAASSGFAGLAGLAGPAGPAGLAGPAAAAAAGEGVEPWRFALDRLRLDGIDTASWSPAAHFAGWRREPAEP